jgi:hypothetical protein
MLFGRRRPSKRTPPAKRAPPWSLSSHHPSTLSSTVAPFGPSIQNANPPPPPIIMAQSTSRRSGVAERRFYHSHRLRTPNLKIPFFLLAEGAKEGESKGDQNIIEYSDLAKMLSNIIIIINNNNILFLKSQRRNSTTNLT